MTLAFLSKLEAIQPFNEPQAWGLYKIAALSEAVGWTILITGILIRHYRLAGYRYAVPIAGQIHGTIFLVYFGVLLATYSSLRWSRTKFIAAALAGVPPYGTLVFEQWAVRQRQTKLLEAYFWSIALVVLTHSS